MEVERGTELPSVAWENFIGEWGCCNKAFQESGEQDFTFKDAKILL